jgi:phospholipase C
MLGELNKTTNGVKSTNCNTQTSTGKIYCANNKGAWVDPDPDHSVDGTTWQIYGSRNASRTDAAHITMSGFVDSYSSAVSATQGPHIMDCISTEDAPVISALANAFTLIDTYHAGVPGPTFPNRLFYLSATSHGYGDNDPLQTALGWPQRSVFGSFNSSQWRVYFSDVPSALLMSDSRMGLLTGNYRFLSEFEKDVMAGDLPEFTWVEPGFMDIPGIPATDQHPAHDVRDGERMVKSVYESLRASPIWDESVLLVRRPLQPPPQLPRAHPISFLSLHP